MPFHYKAKCAEVYGIIFIIYIMIRKFHYALELKTFMVDLSLINHQAVEEPVRIEPFDSVIEISNINVCSSHVNRELDQSR